MRLPKQSRQVKGRIIAERVRSLREAWGDTLRTAGARCGMSSVTLMRLERGESCHHPTLNAVAAGYGVPVRWLLGGPSREADLKVSLRRLSSAERLNMYCLAQSRAAFGLTLLFRPEDRDAVGRIAERTQMGGPLLKRLAHGEHSPQLGSVLDAIAEELPATWARWGVMACDEERVRDIQAVATARCFRKLGLSPLVE